MSKRRKMNKHSRVMPGTVINYSIGVFLTLLLVIAIYLMLHDMAMSWNNNEECSCYNQTTISYYGFESIHFWKEKYKVNNCQELCQSIGMSNSWNDL